MAKLDRRFPFVALGTGFRNRELLPFPWLHGLAGYLPNPSAGSLLGYFQCEGDPVLMMQEFSEEIDRARVAEFVGLPVQAVRSFAYPRHYHTKAIIDSLRAEGYLGARWAEN